MSPLQKIKEGIQNNNWSAVTDGYNQLTGENLEIPVSEIKPTENPLILQQIKDLLESTKTPTKVAVSPTTKAKVKEVVSKPKTKAKTAKKQAKSEPKKVSTPKIAKRNGKIDEVDIPVIGPSTSPRGEVNAKGRKMMFPTEQFFDPQEAKANSKKQVDKMAREPYKPFMKECTECHKPFDFNKAYPTGKLDSKTDIYLCETCQTNKR